MRLELVKFKNTSGLTMKGVYASPDNAALTAPIAAVYLPGIVLGTTAVHGLALKIAGQLSQAGIPTLVCDHAGIGESEGKLPPLSHGDLGNGIRDGIFVNDTLDMIRWLLTREPVRHVFLLGHCGGAITALLTAAQCRDLLGLYLISTPLTPQEGPKDRLTSQAATEFFSLYRQKLFSAAAWKKLLTGESSYRTMAQILRQKLNGLRRTKKSAASLEFLVEKRLQKAFQGLPHDLPVWMVIGDRDPGIELFRQLAAMKPPHMEMEIFENTSHGFVTEESLHKLFDNLKSFSRFLLERCRE